MERTLFVLGINHRGAPVSVRERLAYPSGDIAAALSRMKPSAPALSEAALISTCNRVEVIGVTADAAGAFEQTVGFLAGDRGADPASFRDSLYRLGGRDAARHLFRVGASLDSMVIGEPQIFGQLKLAYTHSVEAGAAGLILHRAFHKAFSVAKRVRKSTLIGYGAVSVSSAAVALAGRIFDSLENKRVLLMGAGRMGELTARQLVRRGVKALFVANRTYERAAAIALQLGGTAIPFDSFRSQLISADVIIGSLAAEAPILTPRDFEPIIRARHYRPIFLIDLGVPRNFDERLNAMENVYLYDIDDLGTVALEHRAEREREAEKAELIVEQELDSFMRWLNALGLVPTIKEIRLSIEQLRDYELSRHRAWLKELEPAEQARIESLTRGLVNKLMHRILSGLRQDGEPAIAGVYSAALARRLFCEPDALDDALLDDEDGGDR
ncbi:MAG: glutamyl-tRNA reductase [Candidatus Binataceae bacterium]